MKQNLKILSLLFILFYLSACNREIRNYINASKEPIKVYVEPTIVEIDIYFLRSISSSETPDEKIKEIIAQISKEHAEWFNARLKSILIENGVDVVSRENAELILESKILDMGEVRTRKFMEGLSVGLVLGWMIGEATGDPEIGLAVFVWEVLEEIVIVYLLKSFFMITTIGLKVKKKDGNILADKEFTTYSNSDFERKLPEATRSLRENKVKGSLEQNAKDIAEFLKKEEKVN